MATVKKTIGRLPVYKGDWVAGSYSMLNQVTYLGSTFQSKIDNNTSQPATVVNNELQINSNWSVVSNGTAAYLAGSRLTATESRIKKAEQDIDALRVSTDADKWYGVTKKTNVASPDMARIGWMDNHRSLPYHNRIRPCIVRADRTIAYYLDVNDIRKKADGSPAKLDGTDGQVMVYFPAGYILINSRGNNNGNDNETYAIGLSPFSVDGNEAEYFPAFVKSIDYATVQRSTNKLMSVINEGTDYAGSGSNATAGGVGYPRTSISSYNYTAYARNLGSGWTNSFAWFEMIQTALMYIEYATYQLQKPFNSVLTPEGYKQGGFGVGPQNWSGEDWSAYNAYNPVVKIGEVHQFLSGKNNRGTGVYVKKIQATETKEYTTEFPCWRWISNLWGHLWRWDSGIDVLVNPNGDNPTSTIYMTKDPSKILATNDSDFTFVDSYIRLGLAPRSTGYLKMMNPNSVSANEIGGSSSTYCCAHFWAAIPTSTERRGLHFGARLANGGNALRASADSNSRPSLSYADVGSGLSAYVNE